MFISAIPRHVLKILISSLALMNVSGIPVFEIRTLYVYAPEKIIWYNELRWCACRLWISWRRLVAYVIMNKSKNKKEFLYMFRLWAKIMKENRLLKDTVICDDSNDTRTHKVFHALDEIVYSLTLENLSGWMPLLMNLRSTIKHASIRIIL